MEAKEWGEQWAELETYEPLDWPDEANYPPGDLSVEAFLVACMSFSVGTGLGWDGLHPRALCRLSRPTLETNIIRLMRCEKSRDWPAAIYLIGIVLLPKSDGGFRPIGLLP